MKHHHHHHLLLYLNLAFLLITFPTSCTNGDDLFTKCSSTQYECGNMQGIGYPFWGKNVPEFCGHHAFHLNCLRDRYTLMVIGKQRFFVLDINQQVYSMKIVRWDLWQDSCPADTESLQDVGLNHPLFDYTSTFRNLTLIYGCPLVDTMQRYNFTCGNAVETSEVYNYYADEVSWEIQKAYLEKHCRAHLTTPVSHMALLQLFAGSKTVNDAVSEGFDVEYLAHRQSCVKCQESSGICGANLTTQEFLCLFKDQPGNGTSSSGTFSYGRRSSLIKKSLIGIIGIAVAGILFGLIIACSFWTLRRIIASNEMVVFPFQKVRANSYQNQNIEKVIRQSTAPKRYSYSDVKNMTDSFKNKLGQGGYGSVYKGKLPDGRSVAVKILIDNLKGKGEEFINEVASISRTSHVNIVSLIGFCFEGHKQALIYEFMANGSLDKLMYNRNILNTGCCLGWEYLYEIAIGIARGLEYLHGGCNTQILHFDIKPQNILLDEHFRPKITDFGLSKLCTRRGSITLMEDARGTIGYIAPEVFNRSFGRVSHKSDVYSYGMMILEMVSGRKNANVRADNASKICFPHWIYHHLQLDNDLGLRSVMTKEEEDIARKMILVGLWCIQTNPSHRPCMNEVLVMLEVCSEALEIPPKPFNFSPQNSGDNPSATSV